MTEQEVRRYLRQMKEENSERAFHGFYDLTYDRLFRIAFYYLRREEWAQEVVLDVFMKLWEMRDRLLAVDNIEDYCFVMVKNASLNFLEKEERRPDVDGGEPMVMEAGIGCSPEEEMIGEELFARYVKALDRLPERCREVFIRVREEKQSYAQVAEELGISVNTVDAQMQKAVKRLMAAVGRAAEN